jgi:PP-loop superfamily ATP-utilizing enzyme
MKAAANVGNNVYWQYIVFNYNENNIETAIKMAKDHGIGFILVKSSRWDHNMNHLKPSNPDYYINNPRPVKWA